MKWSIFETWNQAIEQGRPERELKVRDNIWAGELGGAFIDRYLKMTAVKPTNPPNARSLRKFEAGNLFEWIVGLILKRAGIYISQANWLSYQYEGLVPVTGKLDFMAGGKIDPEKALQRIEALGLPEFFNRATRAIIKHFIEKYPDGLSEVIMEVKSCSSFMFERYEAQGADHKHSLQLFHYLKAKDQPEGKLLYICRDDLRMLEFEIYNPSSLEDAYRADIEQMTAYIKNKETPPKEQEILFDEDSCKFSKNWRVEYSSYLTKLYGYERPDLYDEKHKKQVGQFNRVYKRCVADKKMTKLNLEILEEVKKWFPNFDDLVKMGKEKHVETVETNEEGEEENE